MRLSFVVLYIICGVLEARFSFRRHVTRRVEWTTEILLANLSWYILIGFSMLWPDWARAMPGAGATVFIAGRLLVTLAVRVNPYFTPNLRLSPVIVKSGIYKYLNHPAYDGMIISALGVWLYFFSWQALFLLAAYHAIIIARIVREQVFLR